MRVKRFLFTDPHSHAGISLFCLLLYKNVSLCWTNLRFESCPCCVTPVNNPTFSQYRSIKQSHLKSSQY